MKLNKTLLATMLAMFQLSVTQAIETLGAKSGSKVEHGRSEILLSGSDWKLGSFAFEAGEKQKAYAPDFAAEGFRPVPVPAEIQTTLGLKGMELFSFNKELSLVNKKEWWYRKTFTGPTLPAGQTARLVFEGVDYICSVWLNGEKLGDHSGAYMPFSFDVTSRLKPGQPNMVVVKVTCPWVPKDRSLQEYHKGSFALQWNSGACQIAHMTQVPNGLSFIWGGIPGMGNASLTLGIIRDVKLEITPACRIDDLWAYTKSLNADGSATVLVSGAVQNEGKAELIRKLDLDFRLEKGGGEPVKVTPLTLTCKPGANPFQIEVTVPKAQLWWSWDLGAQPLYRVGATLAASAPADRDHREIRMGIRTLERGTDLGYRLNGVPLFIRSGWYPMGDYYSARNTRAVYAKDLLHLRNANANSVVNHTVIEKRDFYELCDELGLLIEVQMPFSQSGPLWTEKTPRYENYKNSFFAQAKSELEQLRSHPSIITFCPYAECGTDPSLDRREPIANMVRELAPGTVFHWAYCEDGEKHFWMATAGMGGGDPRKVFDMMASSPMKFVSEVGSCSLMNLETLTNWITPQQIWSEQANPPGLGDMPVHTYLGAACFLTSFGSMLHFAHEMDGDIRSDRDMVDASQLYQGFKADYMLEEIRRLKSRLRGVRWWAFKDPAPGHQWGIYDFDQMPKLSYYNFKRSFEPLAVSIKYRGVLDPQPAGTKLALPVWVVNDLSTAIPLDLTYQIFDLQGNTLLSGTFSSEVKADEAKCAGTVEWTVPETQTARVCLLKVQARERGGKHQCSTEKYISTVPQAGAPLAESAPFLDHPPRVLVLGSENAANGVAKQLKTLKAEVDVLSVMQFERLAELRDAASLRRKYDVIWLASFEALWKVLDDDMANGLMEAVRQGCGFIHTGGPSSFEGDVMIGSHLSLTPLTELLPVTLRSGVDWLGTVKRADVVERGWTWVAPGVKNISCNQVQDKPGCRTAIRVDGLPLLAYAPFGKGWTVAFTAMLPADKETPDVWRCYAQLLLAARGENPDYRYTLASENVKKPLFQQLKEQPMAQVGVGTKGIEVWIKEGVGRFALPLTNGDRFAHLVRARIEWAEAAFEKGTAVLYSDNAVDLLPKEQRTLNAEVHVLTPLGKTITGTLIIKGSNIPTQRIPIRLKLADQ